MAFDAVTAEPRIRHQRQAPSTYTPGATRVSAVGSDELVSPRLCPEPAAYAKPTRPPSIMRLMTDPWMDDDRAVLHPTLFDTRTDREPKKAQDNARERAAADLRRVVDAMMD